MGRVNKLKNDYYTHHRRIREDLSPKQKQEIMKGIIRIKGRIAEARYLSGKILDILERGFWGEDSGYDAVLQLKQWDYEELLNILVEGVRKDEGA